MSRLPALARLVRLPNLPSALSNVLLAAFAASAPPRLWPAVGLALLASACLYMAGMVWNDWFDQEQDRRERPDRPLPSGQVTPDEAKQLGWALMAGGVLFAILAGVVGDGWFKTTFLALLIVASVFLYDGWAKRGPQGPLVMGLCRALNVLFGLAAAGAADWLFGWHLALVVGLYVAGVTLFARTEARTSNRLVLALAAAIILAALLLALPLPLWRDAGTASPLFPYLLTAFGFALALPVVRAVEAPTPSNVQAAVTRCLLGLVVLDAILASAVAGSVGLLIVLLLLPAAYLKRRKWLYAT
jgi:heme O synthase-like polyprenyltransferase